VWPSKYTRLLEKYPNCDFVMDTEELEMDNSLTGITTAMDIVRESDKSWKV